MNYYSYIFKLIYNDNYNNIFDNNKLFFSIWKNKTIRNEIFKQYRLYKLNNVVEFSNSKKLYGYKYKEYITNLILTGSNDDIDRDDIINLQYPIPLNITSLTLTSNKKLQIGMIPISIQSLTFNKFNKLLESGHIPNNVKSIDFGQLFNQPFTSKNVIPNSVECIKFGNFNKVLKVSDIPSSVTQIEFDKYDQTLKHLPLSIKTIKFKKESRLCKLINPTELPQSITRIEGFSSIYQLNPGYIPYNTQRLSFDKTFTFPMGSSTIDVFPKSLTHLDLGKTDGFQINEGDLPPSLKTLKTNAIYNHRFNQGVLPNGLNKLILSHEFNKPLTNSLPQSLKNLQIGCKFDQDLKIGDLPNGLLKLRLSSGYTSPFTKGLLPQSLTSLNLSETLWNESIKQGVLPKSLTYLSFGWKFNSKFEIGSIPPSVKTLHLGGYNQQLSTDILPFGLENLLFGKFNQYLKVGDLPKSLKSLTAIDYNLTISPKTLPNSITYIKFIQFDQLLRFPDSFPSSIKSLELSNYSKPLLPGILPSSLLILKMVSFNHKLEINSLPSSLFYLNLVTYPHKLEPDVIPSSLTILKLNSNKTILVQDYFD